MAGIQRDNSVEAANKRHPADKAVEDIHKLIGGKYLRVPTGDGTHYSHVNDYSGKAKIPDVKTMKEIVEKHLPGAEHSFSKREGHMWEHPTANIHVGSGDNDLGAGPYVFSEHKKERAPKLSKKSPPAAHFHREMREHHKKEVRNHKWHLSGRKDMKEGDRPHHEEMLRLHQKHAEHHDAQYKKHMGVK